MEIRIDDLAHRAGVPSRTIRYYTQQGLLPPPILKGRVGFYNDAHLDRLRLIKELQEKRFLPLDLIRSILARFDRGIDLELMLAPLDMVYAPRSGDAPQVELTREELIAEAGVDESVFTAAEDMGFLFPVKRGRDLRYTHDDVQMLEVAKEWVELGIPLDLGRVYRSTFEEVSVAQVRAFGESVLVPLREKGLSGDEMRHELVEGYRQMSATCIRLVGLLQRKLIQKAVEAAMTPHGGHRPTRSSAP